MRTRLVPMMRKELREILRDPITLWIAVGMPLVLLILFGSALRLDFDATATAVLDRDRSRESADLIETFARSGDFHITERVGSESEIRKLFERGRVRLAVVIPSGFGRELAAGRTAPVQTLIDGSLAAVATVLRSEVEAVTASFTLRQARAATGLSSSFGPDAAARVWYNPALRSSTFVVPGLFAVILMAFPPLLTALAVVREKETGSVQQIYVSPLRPWEFIAGKMLPYVALAFIQLVSVIALGRLWFGTPFRGNPMVLALGSVLYVFGTVSIGLLVSTIARTQVVAILLALVITVMPSFLFSGFLYPTSSMPVRVQIYSHLFPARHYNVVSRGVLLKGLGVADLWPQFAILSLYAVAVFSVAASRFRKKVA